MRHVGVQDVAERFEPADLEAWAAWLADHHADTPGVWLVTPKASSGLRTFDYEAGILEALRFGWVDSTQRTVDELRTMLGPEGAQVVQTAIAKAGKAEADAIRQAFWQIELTGMNGMIKFNKVGPAGQESGQSNPGIYLIKIENGKVIPKVSGSSPARRRSAASRASAAPETAGFVRSPSARPASAAAVSVFTMIELPLRFRAKGTVMGTRA